MVAGRLLLSFALVALVALVALGCGGGTTTTTAAAPTETTTGGTTGGGGSAVSISNFAFDPTSITIKVGDAVSWTNNDSATHTVVAVDGSFKSGDLGQGATFENTFTTAGTFAYKCSIHPNMTGTVVVQ